MNVCLMFLVLAQLGDGITAIELEDFYKANKRMPSLGIQLQVGDIGILPYRYDPQSRSPYIETSILQVLSDDSALLSVRVFGFVQRDLRVPILSPQYDRTITVMLKGKSTRNLTDDSGIQLSGVWKAEEPESYQSAAGKRTVAVIRPFQNATTDAILAEVTKKAQEARDAAAKEVADAKAAEEAKIAQAKAAKEAAEQLRRESYRRTWKSKDGMFSVDAYFVDQSSGTITLKRADDGKVITVAASTLSPADIDQARLMKLKLKSEGK